MNATFITAVFYYPSDLKINFNWFKVCQMSHSFLILLIKNLNWCVIFDIMGDKG